MKSLLCLRLLVPACLVLSSSLYAQTSISVKDAAEISYKSELLLNEFRDLLNVISNTETDLKQTKDLIYNSHSGTRNKIFYRNDILVEDDILNGVNNIRDITIDKYLNDLDLLYQKSDTASITFENIKVSNIKKADYLYIKVFFTSLFRNKLSTSDTAIYKATNRVAEIRIDKDKNKWLTQITRIGYYNLADTAANDKNDIELVYEPEETGSTDTGRAVASVTFAEELILKERAKQEEAYKKEKEAYNNLIVKGEQSLKDKDYTTSLKAFSDAAELAPYEMYPKIKINQLRKIAEQTMLNDEELYKQALQKAQIAEKERKYEEAKEFYTIALSKKPMESATIEQSLRNVTAKLRLVTELEEKYHAGLYKEAIKDYDKAIKKDNKNSDLFLGRAKCYDKLNEYKSALRDYTSAIDLDNNNLQAWKLRAELYTGKGEYIKALSDYKIYTTINKNEVDIYYQMCSLHSLTGNIKSAIEDLDKVIDINMSLALPYYRKGLLLKQLNDQPNAFANFTTSIKADPTQPSPYYQRGLCNLNNKNIAAAGEDFAAARKYKLDSTALLHIADLAREHYQKGLGLFAQQLPDSAIQLINAAIIIDPYVAVYRFRRGEYYYTGQQYNIAILNYTDAIELNKNYYDAWYKRGLAKFSQKAFEQAIPDLEAASKINPLTPYTYYDLGNAWFNLNKYNQAITQYDMALQSSKSNKTPLDAALLTLLYNNQGKAYFNIQDYAKALECFKNSIRYDKNFNEAYYNRGKTYYQLSELKNAEEDILKALSFYVSPSTWYYTLGEVYQQKQEYGNAITHFTNALTYDSSGSLPRIVYYQRGYCAYQLAAYENALPDYTKTNTLLSGQLPTSFFPELGQIYLQLGKSDSAQLAFKNVLAIDSLNSTAWYGIACASVQKNQLEQAIPLFEKAFAAGTIKYNTVKKDKIIAAIRDDKRFKALVKKYF